MQLLFICGWVELMAAGCIVISLAFSKLYTFKTLNENELKKIE